MPSTDCRRILAMTENRGSSGISVHYDDQSDILIFAFTETPQVIVAEEADDEV
jgi:hypothetical protein